MMFLCLLSPWPSKQVVPFGLNQIQLFEYPKVLCFKKYLELAMRSLKYAVSAWECVKIIRQIIMNDMISSLHTNCHELIVRANKDGPFCWFCFELSNNIQTFYFIINQQLVTYFHSTCYSFDILTSTCSTGLLHSPNLCTPQLPASLILISPSYWVYLRE